MVMQTATDASSRIKARARELGFDAVGITGALPSDEATEHLRAWLAKGYHAGMTWMSRNAEKREDPRRVFPGARSVVAVAMNYSTPFRHSEDPGTGKISRYAWGDDYHRILTERLEMLLSWMKSEYPSGDGRVYVDTGPVLEKVLAQSAGIGWQGKHTNIITRDRGSWVFLGEIMTSLELAPDTPETDHCGTCTLCIDACPTAAIVEPYVVDSGRCISYLTIEHRGPIEGDVRGAFERWIYGCDVCQDVCPWNKKFAVDTTESGFYPREGNRAPDLHAWEAMSEEEFDLRFRGSPVRRTKHGGLIRNIRVVLGADEVRDPGAAKTASYKEEEDRGNHGR